RDRAAPGGPGPAPRQRIEGIFAPDPLTAGRAGSLSLAWPPPRPLQFQSVVIAIGAQVRPEDDDALVLLVTKMPDHEQKRGADGDREQARNVRVRRNRLDLLLLLPDLELQAIAQLMHNGRVAQIELGDFLANVEGQKRLFVGERRLFEIPQPPDVE